MSMKTWSLRVTLGMRLINLMLSERSQIQKGVQCVVLFTETQQR